MTRDGSGEILHYQQGGNTMNVGVDIWNELKNESAELVERFAQAWMLLNTTLEQGHVVQRSDIDELFRILHTLKGLSEIAQLSRVVSALHLIEDRLAWIRSDASRLSQRDLECLAESQLLLEKIFLSSVNLADEELMAKLEEQARLFCESGQSKAKENKLEAEFCAALQADEKERWEEYCKRPDFIYAFDCDATRCEVRDRVLSIGDILIERECQSKHLFVFAAELDQTLVEQIVEESVRPLQKVSSALASLGDMWLGLTGSVAQPQLPTIEALPTPVAEEIVVEDLAQAIVADPEMVNDFLNNGEELLETLTQQMLMLENNPDDKEAVEGIFRAAHTIKGTAGMLGFTCIEQLCHALENTLDRIRKNRLSAGPELTDTLLVGWDMVRSLFGMLRAGENPTVEIAAYVKRLGTFENGSSSVGLSPSIPFADSASSAGQSQASAPGVVDEQKAAKTEVTRTDNQATIRVDLKRLDSLVNLVGELVIDRTRFARIEEAMRLRGASADLSHQMAESLLLFGRHMNEVQNIIMKVRMVPVGNAFFKFQRVVRDLSRQCGKEVELIVQGAETELDKTLVEEIVDPLVHLIRNSVDHGIEEPAQREKTGKQKKGKITLSATQQGNMIVITVQDDGKGLDVERIRAKALKNGIIKESDHLPVKDVFNLIFEPGFSTAEQVTNISGRGVGMDVVKKNIQKLKGIVELDSTPGQGTKTTIKLPITLAIVPSLMVEVAGESFAVPLVNVIESIRISPDEIQRMGATQFIKLRDQVVPLVRFSDALGMTNLDETFWYRSPRTSPALSRRRERIVFVVVGIGHERIGLVVDRLLGQQEIVIKPLGRLLGNHAGLAGGCVLGDGRVALVLDVADVFAPQTLQRGGHARRAS